MLEGCRDRYTWRSADADREQNEGMQTGVIFDETTPSDTTSFLASIQKVAWSNQAMHMEQLSESCSIFHKCNILIQRKVTDLHLRCSEGYMSTLMSRCLNTSLTAPTLMLKLENTKRKDQLRTNMKHLKEGVLPPTCTKKMRGSQGTSGSSWKSLPWMSLRSDQK